MKAFYNENEPYAVEWLRNLERAGHIAPGVVDPRGMQELKPKDLEGYRQAHFFAGIGGWSYALRLAGWPDEAEVWTGSCPCQPWSTAGRRKGEKDDRHLWPVWFALIEECRPSVVFGEQVGGPDGLRWLDLIFSDLEGAGYAVGAANLPAASVGAPHIRQRLFFVAFSSEQRREGKRVHLRAGKPRSSKSEAARRGPLSELGDASRARGGRNARAVSRTETQGDQEGIQARCEPDVALTSSAARLGAPASAAGASFWEPCEWISCSDGKARPTKSGLQPLAHGVPARVGKLRAYGNAIVPQVAALFIQAAMTV
jgi:DNA (cytosine-5)-methyltransferase 1